MTHKILSHAHCVKHLPPVGNTVLVPRIVTIKSQHVGHPNQTRFLREHAQPQVIIHRSRAAFGKTAQAIDELALDQHAIYRPGTGFQKMFQGIFVVHVDRYLRLRIFCQRPHVLPAAVSHIGWRIDQRGIQFGERVRVPVIVGIEKRDKISLRLRQPLVARGAGPDATLINQPDALRIRSRQFFDDFGRAIGRTIVDDDQLPRRIALLQHRQNGFAHIRLGVVARHHDRYQRRVKIVHVFLSRDEVRPEA